MLNKIKKIAEKIGNTKTNGYYWDKVVLDNGKKGYINKKGEEVLCDNKDLFLNNPAIPIAIKGNG